MDPFIRQLAELCRSHPTGAKWVFVPSHALGHTLGERLALEGTSWANLRFTTPFGLAVRMAAPFLVERGVDPSPEGVGPAVVMRLLLELSGGTPAYFRHLADQAKMADALWGAIRELRLAGLTAAELPAVAFASGDKHAELRALLAAYEEHLEANRLADTASVFQEALRHLDVCPIGPADVWMELPGVIWAPLERRFLDELPGRRLDADALDVPGLDVPQRVAALGGRHRPIEPVPTSDSDRLAFLLRPADAPPPQNDGTVAMFRAGGKEAEVEEVLRRIVAARVPLDQVEVAYTSSDYAPLFWEKAQRHGLPATFESGIPIGLTRPARAFLAFCAWIEGGFSAGGLRRLLQSGDVRVDLEDGPTAGQAARLLARSEAMWGRRTYDPALIALAASYRERSAEVEADEEIRARYLTRAAQAERLRSWVADLLGLVPDPDADGRVDLDPLLTACAAFVERVAAKTSDLDGAATAVLTESFNELRPVGHLSRPPAEAFGLIRERVEMITVGSDRARPGHLHVTPLAHAGYAGRLLTFVVGLEEGSVLPTQLEDAVLLDDERQAIHRGLTTSRDRVSEALAAVLSRLAVVGGRVCLSFSCRDLRENRETFPSWLLLQALRLQKPGRELTYEHLNQTLGEPVSAVPTRRELALSAAGWWLANLRGVGRAGLDAVLAAFPSLAQGARAEAARQSETFTVFDGFVPPAGPRLDPRVSGRAVSPTMLERLAGCPFRHFLEHGLGLEPVADAEPDPDRWLDPTVRGSLLHELFARVWRELRERGEQPDPQRHGPRLRELAEARLDELRTLIPPPSERIFEREVRDILRDLELFLRFEAERTDREPVGLEVSFGAGAVEGEPLAQADPVNIDLGTGLQFRLRGRIDRVDRLLDGTYDAVDYKTGRYRPDDYDGTFKGGRLLQHVLYALAARELLRGVNPQARVAAGSYYFPTARGGGERVIVPQGNPAAVAAVLRDLFELLALGTFVHSPDESDCRWCDFRRACGRDPMGRSKPKIDHEVNEALNAYRRLARHA